MRIFVDDEEVSAGDEVILPRSATEIPAPEKGGLYLGGVPSLIEFSVKSGQMTPTVKGYHGTIRDLAFIDDK